jgi:exopolyphosphatase / guanosine-5'-triphosphate,3'-diphosphate pyrophosphatase
MRFAAIDVGSNAVRLLLCNVFESRQGPIFKKAELIRIPIRLGEDTFTIGKISGQKEAQLVTALKAFRYLIDVYEVVDYKACATSAMREASNSREIAARIKKETGIGLEIINGKEEAGIIYSNHADEFLDRSSSYFYIDIG